MVAPPATGGGQMYHAMPNKPIATTVRMNGSVPNVAPPSFPYSARREPRKLDMNTVERKGHASLQEQPLNKQRIYGLPEAPTFRPTEAEFRDPMEYIRSISEKASKYGICKIVPPDNWNPEFAIDSERFHFRTRKQEINLVEGSNRTNLNYLDQLSKFHKQYGQHLNRFPSVDKRPLDLYKLKKAVEVRGGFSNVCKDKKWAEIGRDLGYSGKIMSSLSTSLKNSYQRWLHPYEEWLKNAKHPNGIPVLGAAPMPSPGGDNYQFMQSPLSPNSHKPTTHKPPPPPPPVTEPSQSAPPAFVNGASAEAGPSEIARPPAVHSPVTTAPRPASSTGFTAVNGPGFAAVNGSNGFTAVNHPPAAIKHENHGPVPSPPIVTNLNTGASMSRAHHASPTPAASSLLKRNGGYEDYYSEADGAGDNTPDAHRNKRPRKDMPNPPIVSMRPSTPQPNSNSGVRRHGDVCEHCQRTHDQQSMLVCDTCELSWHNYCIDPPVNGVPEFEWHCSRCLVGNNEYGFEEGNVYSLHAFQEKANSFKDNYFSQRMPTERGGHGPRQPTEEEVEREFWRLVEDITDTVEVEYGADIHSTTHGSGFPVIEKSPLNPYSRDPWNLNVLPFHNDSLFRHIKGDISGMTVPWLYVGMCFSTFCWHNEDHYAYSANYQHFGATKTWYGIPGSDSEAFESAMRAAVPELFETQPDLLYQLVTILPPDQLRRRGVNVFALDQRAGEFVITFPQAYHAGFNHGFNFNEAVNFAPADWEPFGDAGVQRLKEFRKPPCFSHDELLLTAALSDTSITTARWLAPALERVVERELTQREKFAARHQDLNPHKDCTFDTLAEEIPDDCGLHILVQDDDLDEEEYQCHHCKAFCYLSQFRCERSRRVGCLIHAEYLDCCHIRPDQRLHGPEHSIIVRHTNHELQQLAQKVSNKANVPKAWEQKFENLIEGDAQPQLKALQALLAEGEKIDYPLNGLDDLADYVAKCNEWLEEANGYITRKQQNRRKSEKAWRRASTKNGKTEDKDLESNMSIERMNRLIEEGDQLSFSAPQMEALQEKLVSINEWREKVQQVFGPGRQSSENLESLLEEGRSFVIAMPELTSLERLHHRVDWSEQVEKVRDSMPDQTLDSCKELLQRSTDLGIIQTHPQVIFLDEMVKKGELWEIKAQEIMSAEDVHYPQLEALHNQVQVQAFPVNKETLLKMDAILAKNREAKRQIITLVEKSNDPDFNKRPTYAHVREIMKGLEDLNGKPHGAADLEKQVKKHEDWMRKGKKLFGKANAPLHILEQHMKFVEERNNFCFDLDDTPRAPVEPASREASPNDNVEQPSGTNEEEKPVFCLCRQPEAGLMIECEICHDWYHAKCLKLARGKVKETEMFTCPVCDYRVKIPRDAARPKLEDLEAWEDEIHTLPFQPEEEAILRRIIDKASDFRRFLARYTNGNQICSRPEEMPEMLFYLRKLEGAEVLLAYETNVFRQELHKFRPIAPTPPPILDQSLSTRKPRPTKQQKLMKEYGVEKPEDLPAHLRTKQYMRRKPTETYPTGTLMPRPTDGSPSAGGSVDTPQPGSVGPSLVPTPAGLVPSKYSGGPTVTLSREFTEADGADYADSPSPLFSPGMQAACQMKDAMVSAALARNGTANGDAGPLMPLFRNNPMYRNGSEGEDDLRAGLAGSVEDSADHEDPHVEGEYGEFFREMTNQEEASGDEAPASEHQESQATEALKMIEVASNDTKKEADETETAA